MLASLSAVHVEAVVPESQYPASQPKEQVVASAPPAVHVVVTPAARSAGFAHVAAATTEQQSVHIPLTSLGTGPVIRCGDNDMLVHVSCDL